MKHTLTYLFLFVAAVSVAQTRIDTVQFVSVEIVTVVARNQSRAPLVDLKYQSGKRLSDMLSEMSAVYIKSYGVGQLASLTIRGTTAAQTDIQWNGIRLNQPTLGQTDLSLFSLGMQDDVSLNTSTNNTAIGGVLSMNNKADFCNCASAEGTLRYGSFKTFQSYGGVSYGKGRFSGTTKMSYITSANNFKYRNTYKAETPLEEQQNAGVKLLSFIQQFNAKIDTHNQVSVLLWLTESDRQLAPIISKPDSKEEQKDESVRIMAMWKARYEKRALNYYELGFTTAYLNEKLLYINPEAKLYALTHTQVLRNIFNAKYQLNGFGISGAINYDYEQADVASYQQRKIRHLGGLLVNASYNFSNRVTLGVGMRQDFLNSQASPFSPFLRLSYSKAFNNKHIIWAYIHGSRAFRFPTFNDLYWVPGGNPNLKMEKSWKGELNIMYSFSTWLTASVAGYCTYVDDWIQWIPQGSNWSAVNYKRVLSRGFEAGLNVTNTNVIGKKFKIDFKASYSYTKTTNLDGLNPYDQSKGKQLIYVPLHNVVAGLQLQYRRFYIRSTNTYTSTLYTSTDNSQSLKGFVISNLEVGKDFTFGSNEVGMAFKVNNIGNADYQSVAQRPMPGRAYEGIIRFKFATK